MQPGHVCFNCCLPAVLEDMPLLKKMRLENNENQCDDVSVMAEMRLKSGGPQCEYGSTTDETPTFNSPLSNEEKHLITRLGEIEPDAIPQLEGSTSMVVFRLLAYIIRGY